MSSGLSTKTGNSVAIKMKTFKLQKSGAVDHLNLNTLDSDLLGKNKLLKNLKQIGFKQNMKVLKKPIVKGKIVKASDN
jgi:hypothetical protein